MIGLLVAFLLLIPASAFAQGSGFFIAAPGTGRPDCTSITNPVTNQSWCARGISPYEWEVWNGTAWVPISGGGGGGVPAPPNTSVQFNDSGAFGGNAGFIFDKNTARVGIGVATPLAPLDLHADPSTNTLAGVSGLKVDVSATPKR